MVTTYTIKPTTSLQKGSVKPDFTLLPANEVAPTIIQQPTNGLAQTTYKNVDGSFKDMIAVNGTATIIKGSNFTISVKILDPSNVLNPDNLENIKIVWIVNGSELHQYTQQNNGKGVQSIAISNVDLIHNGDYVVQATNKYGTTISETLTIQVIDPNNNTLLNNNLIQNPLGAAGTDGWNVSADIITNQFDDSFSTNSGYASIVNKNLIDPEYDSDGNFVRGKDRYFGEPPFKFTTAPNETDFKIIWEAVKKGTTIKNEKPFKENATCLISNERSGSLYSNMYPSPYTMDAYNKLKKPNRGLVSELSAIPTYFTRDKLTFNSTQTSTISQIVDIGDLSNLVDGTAVGIDEVNLQFFCYLGSGISKYKYELLDSFDNIVNTYNTYIVSPIMWSRFIKNDQYNGQSTATKNIIPNNVVKIRLVPVAEDTTEVLLSCFDDNGNTIRTTKINGPTVEDLWAVKQKFFLSTYINKLFNFVTEFNKNIPVYIGDKKYFELEPGIDKKIKLGETSVNNNLAWLLKNYPKYIGSFSPYSLSAWETGGYALKGFDKGVAAFFGYTTTFTLPKKTRSIQVQVNFTNNTKARVDQNPRSILNGYSWNYDDIYATHLASKGIYQYNYPKTGATLFKLTLSNQKFDEKVLDRDRYSFPTYFIPNNNVWYDSKAFLQNGDSMDETRYITYTDFAGPYPGQNDPDTDYVDVVPSIKSTDVVIGDLLENYIAVQGSLPQPITAVPEETVVTFVTASISTTTTPAQQPTNMQA